MIKVLATTVQEEIIEKMKKIREKKGVPFGKIIELSFKDSKYFQEISRGV